MSVAASWDVRPRTRDWYVELLIVFAIMVYKIAKTRKRHISVPCVVHILWTETTQPLLQPSLEPSNSALSSSSAPSTPEISQRVLEPSSEPSGGNQSESSNSSIVQPTPETDLAIVRSSLEVPGPSQPSEIISTLLVPATHQAMGSVLPKLSTHYDDLQKFYQDDIDQVLRNLDPSLRDRIIDKINKLKEHKNFGKCAETVPYLCIACGGLNYRQIYGLAFDPYKLQEKDAREK
ncbi:hypothetical protein FRC00_012151 [Tulasnella sp. 408]|nr:hypothetical protein FRC00_012151 [Tulasnella sp. 408]